MVYPDDTTPARSGWRGRTATAPAFVLALLLCSGFPLAVEAGEDPETAGSTSLWDGSRIQLHGFLTQAYAVSDGNQIVGIEEDGTHDYRSAAIQLRYRMSEKDHFLIQLAHEALGGSPRAEVREDVELDWIFYQRRLLDGTEVKVGRVPIPRGIYNEILDVGTILPFYRPPLSVYAESGVNSETVEGVVLSHLFFGDSLWPVDLDVFYGGWDFVESDGERFADVTVEDGMGFQAWVRTPVQGLRVGLSGQQFLASEGLLRPPDFKERWKTGTASIEWIGSRAVAQAEYVLGETDTSEFTGYYAYLGIHLTRRLTLNLQYESADLEIDVPGFFFLDVPLDQDRAVGLNYSFSSGVVGKLEVHSNEGYAHVEEPAPNLFGPPAETDYGILSLSVSF